MMKRDREGENEGLGNYAVEGIRRLRGLGYQVRLVQLDSRSFGSPQNRTRLFIICARKGVPLPSIPEPTHANPELIMNVFDSGGAVTSRSFYVGTKGEAGSAPLPPVTVRDAISDLPPWGYIHPSPPKRGAKRIPQFSATTPRDGPSRVGFLKPVPYGRPPSNDYQMSQRGGSHTIANHYTPPRSERELAL
jgi:DNA (cytosine-5)-methyltransferase 1